MSDDDDVPCLPADTLAILQDFLQSKAKEDEEISEDWQLSQFWYDDHTTKTLCAAVKSILKTNERLALISCPTLMEPIVESIEEEVVLLEFDKRFQKYGDKFVFYDYRNPVELDQRLHGSVDLIVADPPFLSEECLTKTTETIKLLKRNEATKIILCTGAVMAELAEKLIDVKPSKFHPQHKNNLANEFRCYTNFGELPSANT